MFAWGGGGRMWLRNRKIGKPHLPLWLKKFPLPNNTARAKNNKPKQNVYIWIWGSKKKVKHLGLKKN